VRKRLPNDGRAVGVLMSGGLDSSTVAGVCRQLQRSGGNEVRAYSGIFPANSSVDESGLIDSLRAHLEIPVSQRAFTGSGMVSAFLEFLTKYDLPTVTPNLFFLLPLQQLAYEDGVRVFFDGDGGDELFGLSAYLLADRVLHLRLRDAARLTSQLPFGEPPDRRTIDHYFREYGLRGTIPYVLHRRRQAGRLRASPPTWLNESTARAYGAGRVDTVAWKRARGPRWWRYLSYLLTRNKELGGLYDTTRRIRWMGGLSPAHPFADDGDLIEFALQIPPELLFSQAYSRPLLREAMRGIVPEAILRRPGKAVFTNLLRDDLTGPDGQFALELLSNPSAEINAYVRREITSDLAARALRGEELGDDLWVVWRLLATECWLQSQLDPGFAERATAQLHRASSTQ
jgi:asparagine synthase (glutamine-hydrolysing)